MHGSPDRVGADAAERRGGDGTRGVRVRHRLPLTMALERGTLPCREPPASRFRIAARRRSAPTPFTRPAIRRTPGVGHLYPAPRHGRIRAMHITWHLRSWAQLSAAELHAVLQLRSRVFVVEQACVFLDVDGRDPDALHLLGATDVAMRGPQPGSDAMHGVAGPPSALADRAGDAWLAGYARLFAPGDRYHDASCIGRVVTHPLARGTGAGRALMGGAIAACESRWPGTPIRLEAQQHLERFYASLGFATTGETYMEDGIPHVSMRRG